MAVSAIFVEFNYVLFLIHIKNGKKYFSRMQKEESSGRALGLDPFFRDGLCF